MNVRIMTCIEGRVLVTLVILVCAVCKTVWLCFSVGAHIDPFQVIIIRDSNKVLLEFLKHMF